MTQHMLQLNALMREAFGMQHQHEVTPADIEHGSTSDPRDQGDTVQADGQHRQHQRGPGARARHRKPFELHRKQQDHQQTEPKTGQGGAQQDQGHHAAVNPAVFEYSRQGPGGDAHDG